MAKIEFYRHSLDESDIASAVEVLSSVFLTTGPMVEKFEKKFAAYLDAPYAVGLMSCTAALHLALVKNGIGPGDEVITTPFTYVATATAIIETGAIPVFVDVNPKSGLLDPRAVEQSISGKTKAILPVHLYGRMVDMRAFKALADRHNLILVEDSAHCIEGERDGIRPGRLSRAACFSFYATKNMTCGEGGALVCHTKEDSDWYKSARNHGISKEAFNRYHGPYQHWDMTMMGWKCNMNDIQAALLLNQLERIDPYREQREKHENLYRDILGEISGMDFIEPAQDNERAAHYIFTVLVPLNISRDQFLTELQQRGVGCAVNYRACHTLSYFKNTYGYASKDFPVAYEMGQRTITLPLYPKMTEAEVMAVCRHIENVLAKMGN